MRQVVLDTETTGLEPAEGHRIIEIGCVEIINRRLTSRHYHQYLNPERAIDEGALKVHGIDNEFLLAYPRFSEIADEFLEFVRGAELIIHNAPFDVGFIDHEFQLLADEKCSLTDYCSIEDTLARARKLYPGKKNSLDALCSRYEIDNSKRDLHGALLDAQILADVYLTMTGGQLSLALKIDETHSREQSADRLFPGTKRPSLVVVQPTDEELMAHRQRLQAIDTISAGKCLWRLN